ncbi:MAG TPA: tyrosine-type recombinase/integrase [Clostridiales bacterium]|nr:tyrosine-type recombinase/integrase [Clostridiales bacterium]
MPLTWKADEIITKILISVQHLTQDGLDQLKSSLYMHLGRLQIFEEETALATGLDDNDDKINLFLATLKIEGRTDGTIEAYKCEYRVFFDFVNKNFRDITVNDIRIYLAHCKTVRKNIDSTINNRIHNLKTLFKWLLAEEYILKDPMLKIKQAKTEQKVMDTITDMQAEVVRCSCDKERDKAIVNILSSTGMRVGELVKLNRSDIDFINGECIVYGKGRKERPVYLDGRAKVHLMWYLESRTDNNPALFVGLRAPHNRLSDDGVRAMLNRICSEDIKLNPHKFRRTMATNMLNNGAPVEHVKEILGHKYIQTTLQCYARLSSYVIKDAHRRYAV